MDAEKTLAQRLGVTTHVSPLRMRIKRLIRSHAGHDCLCMEDWLLDLANHRGARSVTRSGIKADSSVDFPDRNLISNAELVIAICQPQNRDRPQWLRAAAELISKGDVDIGELISKAKRERVERVLAELSRQALKVESGHSGWLSINNAFLHARPYLDPLIHWTRLTSKKADPALRTGRLMDRPLAR